MHSDYLFSVCGLSFLLMAAGMAALVGLLINRRAILQKLVHSRTAELRESEQFNREVISGARDGIVVYDREFRYRVWNSFMETLTGVPASESLGKKALDLFPYLREHKVDALLERALAGETVQSPDIFYQVPQTGRSGWVSGIYSPHHDANGEIIGVIGIVRDITERKQVEEALRESENRYRTVIENIQDIFYRTDKKGILTMASPSAARLLGYDFLDEIVGKSIGEFWMYPEKQAELLRRIHEDGPVTDYEVTAKKKDGSSLLVSTSCAFYRNEAKKILGIEGIIRDITERKRSEEALSQKTAFLTGLLDSIPDRVFFKNLEGVYLGCNPEFARFVGRPREEIVGRSDDELFSKENADFYRRMDRDAMEGGKPIRFERWIDYPDGRRLLADTMKAPLRSASGEVIGLVGVSRDITALRQTEKALQQQLNFLGQLIEAIPLPLFFKDRKGAYTGCNKAFEALRGLTKKEIIGKTVFETSPEDLARFYHQKDQELFQHPGTQRYEGNSASADGTLYDTITHKATFTGLDGEVDGIVGLMLDITEQKRAEKALRRSEEEARRLAQENAIMAEIGRIASSTPTLDEVYERFAGEVRKLLEFENITVAMMDPGKQSATVAHISGTPVPGRESGTVMPLAGTAMEYICETRSSLLVRKENLEESIQRIPGLRPAWEAGRRAMIVVPLILENEVIGTLSIFSCKPDAYTARDLSTVERVATQIAGAVANAQLFRERQLAEEELKRSEERFRDLYDTAPVGYHEYDVEGRMTRVNRTELEMLGYTREEMIGQYMWKFNVGEDIVRQEILEKLKGLRPPGRALQRTYRRKDGTTLTVLIEDRLNKDEGGNITGIRCTIQDITEHKRMEGALRESEDRWQFALQGSGDGVWDWNPQTNQIYYSSQWKAMIGFRDEEVSDTLDEWEKRVHPDDSPSVKAKIGEHLRGESQIYTSEHRVLCKDGSYKWILDRGKVVSRSEDGRPLRMIGTFSDITDRRKGEEAIRLRNEEVAQERRNLQLIFDSVQVGLVLVDGDGEIRRANYNFAKSVGRPLEEVLNRRPGEAIFCASLSHTDRRCGDTPDCRKCPIRGLLNRVLGEGTKVWGLEISIKIIRKGELRSVWLNLNGTPLTVDGHRHALVSVIDTTSRKNMELSLAAAKEAAEAADRAKSKFLANMSHEIRTPMNGVIGMTGLLLDTPLSPEQRQYAELARSSGESLLLLINDILDFSKIEARKLELDSVDFDLRATLEDVVEMLAFKAQEKGLEMVCLLDPDTPSWLRGDPGRLRQIIVNLSANAVKFTAQGGVTIRAKVAAEDDHSVTLRFAITDTGIGIPKDKQSILFSPFTQIDGSITRKYGGTGLGLAISRQLVDLMGGRIGVESEEGKGSTFWFTAAFDRSPSVGAQEHRPAADLKGVRVLVVEHHGASRLQITTLLTSWGCDVDEATDGKSAMAMLLQSAHSGDPFQIALIANPLPDQEGTELGRRIKENREIREVRLVLLTSLGQRGDAARVEKIGFSGYLTKPVRQSQLRECLGLVSGRKEDPEEKTSRPLVTRHTITESLKRRVRILLAEDNPTSRMVALKILEKLGYRADAVDDGRKAIETLRDTPYDLVLMDCQMPEMDGFEATRCIRSGESGVSNPGIPIIALTAHAMKGDREVCLETGMNDYLAKPIRPEELAASLDRWLGRAANERAAVGAILESSPPVISEAASPEKGGGPSDSEFGGEGVFDRDGFMNRIMGDMELARTLAEGFLADMPVQIKKLKAAIGTGDSSLAGKQAHRIKGAALTIGGIAFQKIAYSMELAGKAGNLKMLGAQMSQLEEEFENLKEFIQKTWSMQENPRKGGKNESN